VTDAGALSADDLRFINLVASRTFGAGDPAGEARALEDALASLPEGPPNQRAAALADALLRRRVFAVAPLTTAFLAMSCQLELSGVQLLSPQGAIVGMVRELADGAVDARTVARWLEDRSVPIASEG
jgi:hypothetical protein